MGTVMKASEFVAKLKDIADNYKTLYVMGCFGAPMTAANKKRYVKHTEYNQQATRTKMINNASEDTFGFDCVCLIKGVLWGWTGDKSKTYGGAKYAVKGVPDIGADSMIKVCKDVSTDFSNIEIGEAVWTNGHIGVYIGDGLAIECTPAWKNKVQYTACNTPKTGYNTRKWKKHGKLPYIDYTVATTSTTTKKPTATKKPTKVKIDYATHKDTTLTGKYVVNAPVGLHIRAGATTKKPSLGVLKGGTIVTCFGYYSINTDGTKWLYVVAENGTVGFCSMKWLKKC